MRRFKNFKDIQEFLQNIDHKGGLIEGNNPVCNTGRDGRQGRCDIVRPAEALLPKAALSRDHSDHVRAALSISYPANRAPQTHYRSLIPSS